MSFSLVGKCKFYGFSPEAYGKTSHLALVLGTEIARMLA